MRNLPWFRFYHESLDDPKVQRLEPVLYKAWVNLLCLAARHGGELPGAEDVAFALRLTATECESVLADLCHRGLLDGEATLAPHNWRNRQPPSDADTTSAERQQRYRQRRQGADENAVQGSGSNGLRHGLRDPARTEQNRTEQNRVKPPTPIASEPVAASAAVVEPPVPAKVQAVPKPNKVTELVDAVKAVGLGVNPSPADIAAVKRCPASAAKLASAYVAAYRGEWPPDSTWLRDNLSLAAVCKRIDGYEAFLAGAAKQARASPGGRGGGGLTAQELARMGRGEAR